MTFRHYLLLFLAGLLAVLAVAVFQTAPGYMDADYYLAGGIRLANGHGFSELILWNYLDNPVGLPHPSHAYWMPLASLLAALGIKLFAAGQYAASFPAARSGFLLLAACLPPLTAALSFSFFRRRRAAILAGLLAVFPAFYLPFIATTDTFGLYMLLGGLWFLSVARERESGLAFFLQPALLGILAGLMHLARADGILWLFLSLAAIFLQRLPARETVKAIFFCLLGYSLVAGPWLIRNLAVFGTPLSPGGSRALWINNYDELFSYPADLLTPLHWLKAGFWRNGLWLTGLWPSLQARLWALGQNLQTALAVQGQIFLVPLILPALRRLANRRIAVLAGLAWLITFSVMTLVFPFQGARGGFFHSGAAIQPFIWAIIPAGLEAFIDWGMRARRWPADQSRRVFSLGLVALAALLTVWIAGSRVIGGDFANPAWGESARRYARVEQAIQASGAGPQDTVMVNNPAGYFVAARRPAIAIPYGDLNTVLAAASRYQASFLVVEIDQIQGPEALFSQPADRPGLRYEGTEDNVRIYRFMRD